MSSVFQELDGLAPQGYYEEELDRIRNRGNSISNNFQDGVPSMQGGNSGNIGDWMDFYNRQKSVIFDGQGNQIGFNHGYGKEERWDPQQPGDDKWISDEEMERIRYDTPQDQPIGVRAPDVDPNRDTSRDIDMGPTPMPMNPVDNQPPRPTDEVSGPRRGQIENILREGYQNILGRDADAEGLKYWTDQVMANPDERGYGRAIQDAMDNINRSEESINRTNYSEGDRYNKEMLDRRRQIINREDYIGRDDSRPLNPKNYWNDRREPPRRRGDDQFGPGYGNLPDMPFPQPDPGPRPPRPEPPRPEPRPRPIRPEPLPSPDPGPDRPPRRIDDGDGFPPGFDPFPGLPIGGNTNQDAIEQFYRTELGRDADRAGMDYWMGRAKDGMSLDDIEKSIQQSNEAIKNRISRGEIDPPEYVAFGGETFVEHGGQPHAAGSGTRRESSIEPAVAYRGGRTPSREEHESNLQELRDTEDDWRGPLERYGTQRNKAEENLGRSVPTTSDSEKRTAQKRAEVQQEQSAQRAAQENVGRSRRESISRPTPTLPKPPEQHGDPAPSRPVKQDTGSFLDNVYQKELGRAADKGGKDYWAKEISSGRQTRDQVVDNIRRSSEYQGRNK